MFKKLKSLFVIEDESIGSASKIDENKEVAATKGTDSINVDKPVFDKDNPPKEKVDEKFINRLLGAIDEANLEGFDYLEYKQSLQNLGKVEMPEDTKFKSALAMATTMGATAKGLLNSANHYLKILKDEENKFLEAFKNQQAKQISEHNSQLKNLESSIENKKKQIALLQKEVESETQKLNKMTLSINESKAKVESTKNSFYQAYYIVAEQIKEDIIKMDKYLK